MTEQQQGLFLAAISLTGPHLPLGTVALLILAYLLGRNTRDH